MNKIVVIMFTIFLTMAVASCSKQEGNHVVMNMGPFTSDSVKLCKYDTIFDIHIGERVDPRPLRSQLIDLKDNSIYYILDEQKLYSYDLKGDSLISTVDLKKCGTLNNYSGFIIHNDDSLFVYDYKKKELFLLNDNHILKTFNLQNKGVEVSPEALSETPIVVSGENVIMSGIPISGKNRLTVNDPISLSLNMKDGSVKYGAHMSDDYSKGYFGGVYYNTIYQCKDSQNRIVYSFPASNYIYRYNNNLELLDSLYMGSRYTRKIESTEVPTLKFLKNEEERLNYYAYQDSYANVIFDPLRDVYYRIAQHPSMDKDKPFPKPFSIIAMDKNGKIISETSVLGKNEKYNTGNMHVCKEGLLIQEKQDDENIIRFHLFKLDI